MRVKIPIVSLVLVVVAFFVQIEQYAIWRHWWDLDQILHHETLTLCLLFLALGIFLGVNIKRLARSFRKL